RRDIEGNWELKEGATIFNYGPLTLAIKDANKNGIAFVIINEINAIRENEQISLNSLLSESHINLISKGFEKHELNSNSKLIIMGTMNKSVAGINKLQEAFEDRFIISPEINYPLKNKEIDIAIKISGCRKKIAEIVLDAARQIRKQAIQDFSITKIFSTRLVVNFCMLISQMPPKFLKNNIENVILNKLGNTTEEKKSIAMILDGKMFESKLREELIKKEYIREEYESNLKDFSIEQIISKTKLCFDKYIKTWGKDNTIKKNGNIMWKPLQWMWNKNRKIIQEYVQLTEFLSLPIKYKQETGKDHIYNEELTLYYIRWLYQQKTKELTNFMTQIFPVL
ncbi:MAG: AAA family ATPase, partial [Candidatus Hodarchaeota archaeon]